MTIYIATLIQTFNNISCIKAPSGLDSGALKPFLLCMGPYSYFLCLPILKTGPNYRNWLLTGKSVRSKSINSIQLHSFISLCYPFRSSVIINQALIDFMFWSNLKVIATIFWEFLLLNNFMCMYLHPQKLNKL